MWLNSFLGLLYIFECFAVMLLQGMQHFCKIKISFGTRGKREPEQLTLIQPFHSKDPISIILTDCHAILVVLVDISLYSQDLTA